MTLYFIVWIWNDVVQFANFFWFSMFEILKKNRFGCIAILLLSPAQPLPSTIIVK